LSVKINILWLVDRAGSVHRWKVNWPAAYFVNYPWFSVYG